MRELYRTPILRTLSYFHVFQYPLTADEVMKFLSVKATLSQTEEALQHLVARGEIFQINGFYSLSNDIRLAERRVQGNLLAERRIKKARRIARFLGNFPFVESVLISGSLSKDFSTPDGDLDFFIITAENRLWIARTLMHFFKKLTFLVKAEHSFCMNYYISMENMEINPKNMFTATELATLKPAFVQNGVEELYEFNRYWIKLHLPNMYCFDSHANNVHKKWWPTQLTEKLVNVLGGSQLNRALYNMTKKKWIAKWNRKGYDVAQCVGCMDLHYNTPVNYPKNLPEKILDSHQQIYAQTINRIIGAPVTISL